MSNLCDPLDLLGSSVHGDSPGKNTGVGRPDPGVKPGSLALQVDSLPAGLQGSPH